MENWVVNALLCYYSFICKRTGCKRTLEVPACYSNLLSGINVLEKICDRNLSVPIPVIYVFHPCLGEC